MPEQPIPPVPEATPGLVRAPTNALALIQRTGAAVSLTQLVQHEASATYWFERGLAATQAARWDEAAHAYRQCVERDAEHWRAGVRLAEALGRLGQAEGAAKALVEASDVAFDGWVALAAELEESSWQSLREAMEKKRSTAHDGFKLLLGLAMIYNALKNAAQARFALEVMKFMYNSQSLGSAQWFWASGLENTITEQWERALVDYNKSLELKNNFILAYTGRSLAKRNLKDYTGSISDCDESIRIYPFCSIAHYSRGITKYLIDDNVGAIKDFDQAIALKPGCADIYSYRAWAKAEIHDFEGAINDLNQVIRLTPDDVDAYQDRGDVKYDLGDYAGALIDYNYTIEQKPDAHEAYTSRGNTRYCMKDYIGSIIEYDTAISIKPDFAQAYFNRALSKEKIGDTAEAAADRVKAAELEAQQPAA